MSNPAKNSLSGPQRSEVSMLPGMNTETALNARIEQLEAENAGLREALRLVVEMRRICGSVTPMEGPHRLRWGDGTIETGRTVDLLLEMVRTIEAVAARAAQALEARNG